MSIRFSQKKTQLFLAADRQHLYLHSHICRGSEVETDRFYKLLNERFECKDDVILTPESGLSFLGCDISCEDYDEQDSIGLNPNNTLQTNKHGKVRMIYMINK